MAPFAETADEREKIGMQKKLFRCFEGIYIVVLSLVFLVAVTGTKRNVVWYKELFVTVVMLGAMCFLFWLLVNGMREGYF